MSRTEAQTIEVPNLVDIETLTSEHAKATRELADLRGQEVDAEAAVEAAKDALHALDVRLRKGDTSVTTEDLIRAKTEVERARALHQGIVDRARVLARQVDRFVLPELAVLAADLLNSDPLLARFEWFPVGRRTTLDAGDRGIGLIYTEKSTNHAEGYTSGTLVLQLSHDPLTRFIDPRDVQDALERTGRVSVNEVDGPNVGPWNIRNQTHRVHVGSAWVSEVPVLPRHPKGWGGGPVSLRTSLATSMKARLRSKADRFGSAVVRVPDVTIGAPVAMGDGQYSITFSGDVLLEPGEASLPALVQLIESEADQARPAYSSAGRCIASEVGTSQPEALNRDVVALPVKQTFTYRLVAA